MVAGKGNVHVNGKRIYGAAITAIAAIGLASGGAHAQNVAPVQNVPAATTGSDRDASNGDYGGYFTWPEIKAKIASWQKARPDLVHIGTLGKTLEGRDIPLIRLSDDADINTGEPELLVMAGIHPREQQPQVCLLRLVDEFLTGYGKDARLTNLVKTRQIWIIPVLNVDGKVYDMAHGDGKTKGADWRKNRRPNVGGADAFGVDLNRNFGVRWGGFRETDPLWKTTTDTPRANIYEGPEPFSEPESRALAGFIAGRPNLRAFMDVHSPLRILLYPSYAIGLEMARFTGMVKAMRDLQKDPYPIGESHPDRDAPVGSRVGNTGLTYTWAYYTRGVYGFNFEIGIPNRYPPVSEIYREYERNVREPLLHFLDAAASLPPSREGTARALSGAVAGGEAAAFPGAIISYTPQINGRYAYAVLVSEGPEAVVQSEFRLSPIKTGFTLAIGENAKPGAQLPLTVYVWDDARGVTATRLTLTVGPPPQPTATTTVK